MGAVIQISQATGPASSGAGFAYTGGVNNQLVTLQSVGAATTHEVRILVRPTDDATILTQVTATSWTFTPNPTGGIPTGGASYRVELVTDRGLSTESKQIRVFAIRDSNGLLIPPFGTRADPLANIPDLSDTRLLVRYVGASELNEPDLNYPSGNPFGWEKEMRAVLAAGAVGAAGGGGKLIFEWNGVDVSQFDTTTVYAAGGSLGAPSLAVVADPDLPGGNYLEMSAAGVGEGYVAILANDALPSKDLRIRAEIRGTGTNGQGFVWWAEDATGLYCYAWSMIGTSRYWRTDAGVASAFSSGNSTTMVASGHGTVELTVRGEKQAGAGHRGWMEGRGRYSAFATARGTFLGVRQNFPGEPAPAGWNPLTANRWGLCMYGAGGGAVGPMQIASLQVFEL